MKTVFFGASHNVFPIIEALRNFGLQLVITTETEEKASIIPYCKSKGIEVLEVHSKEELRSKVLKVKADLGIVADFGLIIPPEVLNHFKHGILNVHPSLLPKYRGTTPVQTAILAGEHKTGVSIIKLDVQMDHGPVLAAEERQISPDDTSQSLYEILFREGARLLSENIEPYVTGRLIPRQQNHDLATFTKILNRQNGYLNVLDMPEFDLLDRMTRAYFPWPGVWTRAQISKTEEKLIKFLPFKRVQVEGKKEMSYIDFINGYPDADSKLIEFLKNNADS
jgi:methionyl-tRNA formyltransferase